MADGTRSWQAPDLTANERADLEAIDGLDWSRDDEGFKREWAELHGNPNWYEELKASWGAIGKRKKTGVSRATG